MEFLPSYIGLKHIGLRYTKEHSTVMTEVSGHIWALSLHAFHKLIIMVRICGVLCIIQNVDSPPSQSILQKTFDLTTEPQEPPWFPRLVLESYCQHSQSALLHLTLNHIQPWRLLLQFEAMESKAWQSNDPHLVLCRPCLALLGLSRAQQISTPSLRLPKAEAGPSLRLRPWLHACDMP